MCDANNLTIPIVHFHPEGIISTSISIIKVRGNSARFPIGKLVSNMTKASWTSLLHVILDMGSHQAIVGTYELSRQAHMAPGHTNNPMSDANLLYLWLLASQDELITPK